MAEDEEIDQEFYQALLYERLLYLKFLKFCGHLVNDAEIESLERDVYPEAFVRSTSLGRPLSQIDIDDLQVRLAVVDPQPDGDEAIKVALLRQGHTVLKMSPDRNHKRPHFHIEYKREHKASYAIDPLERIAGDVPSKYERPILEWAISHTEFLRLTWDKMQAGEDIQELILTAKGTD